MSKKAQKNQPQKKEIQIVDQQKDPMLRALQKKVRNMNKKLNQIAQLATKKDLKPEQEQKVNKKNQVVQEKEKYLEMIEVYKEIATESEKAIRKTQLAELQDLAQVLAAKEYQIDLGFLFNQNVNNYVRVLTTPTSNDLTLKQRIDEITATLVEAANNSKLKKNLKQFVLANPQLKNTVEETKPYQNQQPVVQEEPKVQQKKTQQKVKQAEPLVVQAPVEAKVQQNPVSQTGLTATTPAVEITEKIETQQKPTETVQQPQVTPTENNATTEQKGQGRQQKRGYRGYRGNKGPRNGDRNGERHPRNDGQQRPYKKTFKPKYDNEPAQAPKRDRSQSSSSLSSQPQARQFKREQVRELIEDGFIVVGKPKIKAKDPKQFREYHDHQHGNKHHHHHNSKRNF